MQHQPHHSSTSAPGLHPQATHDYHQQDRRKTKARSKLSTNTRIAKRQQGESVMLKAAATH
uniref:Uncharacterized protein MLCL622.29 n=1 Tax=Mycobacterium leprae TaxID=1769 RepID=O06092_MYCLR|nr:unknown [Mycobacterium leprae]